jgi:hypothetical protein|eukprot:Stramenopile-MAST_4_protein_1771
MTSLSARVLSAIARLETTVQRDEGGRGIRHLCQPSGTLAAIATALYTAQNVVLVTGFPCLMEHVVPTETDGPSGTIAICRALTKRGAHAVIVTDDCNEGVLEACAKASLNDVSSGAWRIESFPPKFMWTEADQERLSRLAAGADHILALERASASLDGNAYTMSGKIMGPKLIAPLDQLFGNNMRKTYPNYVTSAIGDGGNEMGMAGARDEILANIPKGELIASASFADHLLVASVSNWGGYAVAAALEVLSIAHAEEAGQNKPSPLLPTEDEERQAVEAAVHAGARDGVTGKKEVTVDGMDIGTSLGILQELRGEILKFST